MGQRSTVGSVLRGAAVVVAMLVDIVVWDGTVATAWGADLPLWLPPVATIATGAPLLWRFRAPLTTAVPVWLLSCVAVVVVPGWQPFAGLLLAVHAVASTHRARVSVPVALSCALPFGLQTIDSAADSPAPWGTAVTIFGASWVIVTGIAFGFGRWGYLSWRRTAASTARAVRAERLRLARELHDTIASNLTAIMLHATGAGRRVGPDQPEVASALATIGVAGNRAMDEMARLLGVLRDVGSAEHGEGAAAGDVGLAAVPTLMTELLRERGLDTRLTISGQARDLDPVPDRALFRVVNEGLVNAAKYGERALPCELRLRYEPTGATVEIENRRAPDEPVGPLPAPRLSFGWGLTGLRETVEMAGGAFDAGPVDDRFVVRASIPTRPVPAPGRATDRRDAGV